MTREGLILPIETAVDEHGTWVSFDADGRYPSGMLVLVQDTHPEELSNGDEPNHTVRIISEFYTNKELKNLAEDLAPFPRLPLLHHEWMFIPKQTDENGNSFGFHVLALAFS